MLLLVENNWPIIGDTCIDRERERQMLNTIALNQHLYCLSLLNYNTWISYIYIYYKKKNTNNLIPNFYYINYWRTTDYIINLQYMCNSSNL